jgi:hypothetical protein
MLLTAEFGDPQSTAAAIAALKAGGFESSEVEVFSNEPVEFPDGLLDRPSHMSLAAVWGAACFCALAILFVRYTQYDYPVVTGGMPLFSWWATGVVFYELTMFGASAGTFLMFLVESGLLKRAHSIPAPVVADGRIQLRVSCERQRAAAAAACLSRTDALKVVES